MNFKSFAKKLNNLFKGIINKIKGSPLYGRTLLVFFFVAFLIKIGVVYFSYRNLDPIKSCLSYISSDIIILFLVHLLITINSWIKVRFLRLLNDLIVFAMLLIYSIDIFTIYFFQSRVSIMDALTLGSNGSSGFSMAVKVRVFIFLAIGIIAFLFIQNKHHKLKNHGKRIMMSFSICSILYALFYIGMEYFKVEIDYVDNVITLNSSQIGKGNDEDTVDNKVLTYKDYMFNVQGDAKDLNVILVFAESLSAIDSVNMGGADEMPGFDKIQKEGITFENFITNGTTSDTAHISTLYGVIPLINMGANNTPYSGYKLLMEPLPAYLNTQGYHTTFVSAASLDFLNQRAFLSGAGFQTIIGEEAFTKSKMYAFESAPDGDLYDRVLEEVKAQTGKYFIGLQTISFHRPYNTPGGKSEATALKYSDDELCRFYETLKEIGFFDDGILVIVGDHRKMNPAEEGERELFGPNRYTKSVATVVGSGIQAGTINSSIIQHTDFYNSLKKLVGTGPVKIDKTYNDVFADSINRNWAITNAEFYEINRYTVSATDAEPFLFRNLSNLTGRNEEVYNYFSAYLGFEFGTKILDDNPTETDDGIKFIGHRGAIENSPENTLESFLAAKEQGAAGIEFDVSYTKDKQNIVVHGAEMYASNCTKLKVGDYTLDWITKNCTIKNGEKYKTLQEMLELIDGLFDYYFLEIKVYDESLGAEQTLDVIETVRDLNMLDRVIFISYSDAAREVLNAQQDVIFGWDTFEIEDLETLEDNNSKYFLAPYDLLTPETVEKSRSMGKEVATYTVNDKDGYKSVKDMGINIIMTDRIDLLQEYEYNKYYPLKRTFTSINMKKSSR